MNRVPDSGEKVRFQGSDGLIEGVVDIPEPICREEFYEPEALIELENGDKVWVSHERLVSDE